QPGALTGRIAAAPAGRVAFPPTPQGRAGGSSRGAGLPCLRQAPGAGCPSPPHSSQPRLRPPGPSMSTVRSSSAQSPCTPPTLCLPAARPPQVTAPIGGPRLPRYCCSALRGSQVVRQGTLDPRPKVRILPAELGP